MTNSYLTYHTGNNMPAIGNKDSSDRAETKSLLVEMAGYSTVVFLDSWVVWTFALRLGFSQ